MTQPIMKDFPNEFITKRLFIRMPKPGDGEQVYEAIKKSKEELKLWMPFAQKDQTMEDVEANVREAYAAFIKREDLRLHIFNRETKEFIGCTGLHRMDWNVPKFEIGYWIDTQFSGQGYMTEAVQGVTDFAFHELKANRVEIHCDANNLNSRAIPERLGYTLEGILKNHERSVHQKELRDTCIYAKTSENR